MIFKGIDITNLSNIEIYNMVLKRQLPTFPPGFWCSVSKECGIKIANELLRYLIADLYKYSREEIINNVTKEFILNNRLWTPCKLYFGRSPIKYIMAAYPEQFRAYEFTNERIPQGFWAIKENRVEAVRWLIEDKLKWSLEEVKEKFSRDSEKIVWKSTGNDIYYKGKMNSELPIKVSVKYYLNNEETPKTESEDTDMEAEKIRNLLKRYGAKDEEIENFMTDLYETKDEMKDDEEDFNYLDGDTMAKLKATKEGQDLIINAPKMAKDELKKAIKDYLSK